MRVVSVNVGLPRDVDASGRTVTTAIFKSPVEGPVRVGRLNLEGDRQADLSVHGGETKAVYAYPSEHYTFWRAQLPDTELPWGAFGENLTTEGLDEGEVSVGDTFRIGTARFVVTEPRVPCSKLGVRLGRTDIIKRFLKSRRSGFYFRVAEEGVVETGNAIEWLDRHPDGLRVVDVIDLYGKKTPDREILDRAIAHPVLPESWRSYFRHQRDKMDS